MPAQSIPTLQACVIAWERGGQKQNSRFTHRSKQTKMSLLPHLESCVCVRVEASEKSQSLCRLVLAGVFSSPPSMSYPNDLEDPHFGDSYLSDIRCLSRYDEEYGNKGPLLES